MLAPRLIAGAALLAAACDPSPLPSSGAITGDLALSFDAGRAPLDLARPPIDLAARPDLASPLDLWQPDLAVAPDLAMGCNGPLLVPKLPSLVLPNWSGLPGTAVGDLDRDRHLDVVRTGSAGIEMLYGAGDGSLTPGSFAAVGASYHVAIVDLNGDGLSDIAFTREIEVGVMLNQGNRTFSQPVIYRTVNGGSMNLATGDLNEDGNADLLVGDGGTLNVDFYAGKGDGTFAAGKVVTDLLDYETLLVVDVDGDGHLDIVGGGYPALGMTVRFGDGKGAFPRRVDVVDKAVGGSVIGGSAVDLNGDKRPDLVMPTQIAGFVSVALNIGKGQFGAPVHYPFETAQASYERSVTAVDLDGRNGPDLLPVQSNGGPFEVLLNQGNGTFGASVKLANVGDCVDPWQLAVGDFNEDMLPDVVCGLYGSKAIPVLLGNCR